MARITRVKKSLGSKIGEALGGVAAGINQFQQGQQEREKMEIMKQQAERQKEELLMRQEEHQVKMEKVHEQKRMTGASLFMKLSGQYVEAEDKKAFEDANVELMYKAANAGEIPIATAGNIFKVARAHGPKYNIAARQVERGLSAVTTKAWNTMSESDRELAYKEGRAGFAAMRDMDQGNAQHWAGAQEQWEKRWHDKSMQSQKASDARSLHKLKEDNQGPSPTEKTANQINEGLTGMALKEYEGAQKAKKQVPILDEAYNFLLKELVSTGPVYGSEVGQRLQKLISENAQRFGLLVDQLTVDKIMAYAKDAGARAIDTPTEQAFLKATIAGWKQNKDAAMQGIIRMKGIAMISDQVSKDRLDYIRSGGDPLEFDNQSVSYKAVVDKQTGDVKVVKPGEEIPEGYFDTRQWVDEYIKEQGTENASKKLRKGIASDIGGMAKSLVNKYGPVK